MRLWKKASRSSKKLKKEDSDATIDSETGLPKMFLGSPEKKSRSLGKPENLQMVLLEEKSLEKQVEEPAACSVATARRPGSRILEKDLKEKKKSKKKAWDKSSLLQPWKSLHQNLAALEKGDLRTQVLKTKAKKPDRACLSRAIEAEPKKVDSGGQQGQEQAL